jgi:hypothetical protein
MKKVDYKAVDDATERLRLAKADILFPMLLSDKQMDDIQTTRIKKAKKTKAKVKEVTETEYIIKDGGFGDSGEAVDDFDIRRYMADAEDEETGTLHDLKIDIRDLAMAKNFYDYCYNFLGDKINPPFARQMWIGLMLFGEVCPCCSNKEWMDIHNVPVNYEAKKLTRHLVLLEKGRCPDCGRSKRLLKRKYGLKDYIQLANVLGQRSGKSLTLAMYASYVTHKHLKFPPIATLTKLMQSSTELTGTFVSLTFGKARGLMWAPYKKLIEDSKWFNEYFEIMDHYKEKYGKELYKVSTEYMVFHNRNLRMYPSGPRSTVLRGDTRIFAGLDELGLFPLPKGDDDEDETSERANADEAHKSLFTSLGTMNMVYESLVKQGYFTAPKPVLFNVSSPYSMRDKMMRLLKESRTTDIGVETILGINLPTWEVNPGFTRQSPIIAAAYNSNHEKAERDWGANPPAVHSRYVQPSILKEGRFVNGANSHNFIYQYDQAGEVYGKLEKIRSFPYPSVVAIDAGVSNNSFCIVGGHYNFDTGKTVVTTLLECMPTQGLRVNFNLLYQHAILILCQHLNAVGLGADQWQSIDLLNRIRQDMGLNPEGKDRCLPKQYSPKRADFDAARASLENGNLIFPTIKQPDIDYILDGRVENYRSEMFGKPVEHFLLQALTVRDVGPNRAPEKGENMTDDIWRAVVLLNKCIHTEKVMQRLIEAKDWKYDGSRKAMPMPGYASRSGMNNNRYGQMRR